MSKLERAASKYWWSRLGDQQISQAAAARIRAEQLSTILRQTPNMMAANICNALVLLAAFCAGIKSVREIEIGETHLPRLPAAEPVPGYKKAKQVVFSSIYPINSDEYRELAKALDKLAINDASLTYEKDSSTALGFGFRCGFLGLLHLDVIQEGLQREFDIGLVVSAPSVRYKVALKDGNILDVDNPGNWPDPFKIAGVTEPYIKASISCRRVRRLGHGAMP